MNRYVLKDLFKQKGVFPFVIMIIMSFFDNVFIAIFKWNVYRFFNL